MVFAVHKVVDFSCPIDLVKCIKTKFPQMTSGDGGIGGDSKITY